MLISPLLHTFRKFIEVSIKVDSEQQLGQWRGCIMIVFKVQEQLVHLRGGQLKFWLDCPELFGEKLIIDCFLVHLSEQATQYRTHTDNILDSLNDFWHT